METAGKPGDRGGRISTNTPDGAYDAASLPSSSCTGETDVTMETATGITVTVAIARGRYHHAHGDGTGASYFADGRVALLA